MTIGAGSLHVSYLSARQTTQSLYDRGVAACLYELLHHAGARKHLPCALVLGERQHKPSRRSTQLSVFHGHRRKYRRNSVAHTRCLAHLALAASRGGKVSSKAVSGWLCRSHGLPHHMCRTSTKETGQCQEQGRGLLAVQGCGQCAPELA